MASDLNQIDATWAWKPYEPDAKRPWDRRLAAHLFRRAGFGATSAELDDAVKAGPAATIDKLFAAAAAPATGPSPFAKEMSGLGQAMMNTGNPQQLSAWWLYRMVGTPAQLLEKATLFWHGHFATSAAKVTESRLMMEQNELLRRLALGPFEDMVQAISRDPAMLIYLDSTTNRRIRPNENYARELMELFCLGVDQYTETDIKQIARAFTGWEVRRDRFEFVAFQHDTGQKTFLGRTGNFNGDDAVRIILDQPAAVHFIAGKLARYFVCEEPALPPELVEPLAQQLRSGGFRIGPLVRTMLSSNLFFSEHAVGRKVRSPVELGVGLLRSLEGTADMFQLAQGLDGLEQAVFFPPNVKGWDGGRTWINSSTLLGRANLVHRLVLEGVGRFGDDNKGLAAVAAKYGKTDAPALVDWLCELLVAVPVPPAARKTLIDLASSPAASDNARVGRVVHATSALPEFQLC
jgi:uncharacterized protein (DUF1800 family)